jgi:predicted DNA-binding transcriptional regulator YafY
MRRKSSLGATERMLLLLRYLSESSHSMSQLGDRLEADMGHKPDRVTIQNDLTRLRDWGFPLAVEAKKRVLTAPVFPVRLSEETLDALRIAFKLLDDTGLISSVAALREIVKIIPQSQRKLLERTTGVNLAPQVMIDLADHHQNINKLEQAIRGCQEIEFYYVSRGKETPVFYHLEPMHLDWKEGRLYLLGYQVKQNYEMSFRIDRIVRDVKVLPFVFARKLPRTYPISFRIWGKMVFNYQKRFEHEDEPISDPCDRHPDALLIKAETTSYFWAKQRLLRYLPYVEIISPDSLVQEFKEIALEMSQLYLKENQD